MAQATTTTNCQSYVESPSEEKEWQTYVWLDKNGEPRSIQTIGLRLTKKNYIGEAENKKRFDASLYPELPVDSGVTGYPPRGDALFWAVPFAVYVSPIPGSPGLIFLCSIIDSDGKEQLSDFNERLSAEAADEPLEHIKTLQVTQQFYLTTKFVPVSFATNPPVKPGPFGSGVGADLAVGRATVVRAVNWLGAAGGSVCSVSPLTTPSHWGVGIWTGNATRGGVCILADHVMLFRYFVGRACEESNLTPAFIAKLLKEPWPPSVLQVMVKSVIPSDNSAVHHGITLAKRLQPSHDAVMRAVTPISAAVGGGPAQQQEIEEYVWGDNTKGPVTVASRVGKTWLIDNRIPSSANPHIALTAWVNGWTSA